MAYPNLSEKEEGGVKIELTTVAGEEERQIGFDELATTPTSENDIRDSTSKLLLAVDKDEKRPRLNTAERVRILLRGMHLLIRRLSVPISIHSVIWACHVMLRGGCWVCPVTEYLDPHDIWTPGPNISEIFGPL